MLVRPVKTVRNLIFPVNLEIILKRREGENMDKPSDVEKIAFTFQSIKPRGDFFKTFVYKMKDRYCHENN